MENFGLSDQTKARIHLVFQGHPEIEKAVIYGSRAKGNFKPGSDIDLTLFGPKLTHQHLLKILDELDDLLLPYMIDLSIYDQIKNEMLKDRIDRVGQTFYVSSLNR